MRKGKRRKGNGVNAKVLLSTEHQIVRRYDLGQISRQDIARSTSPQQGPPCSQKRPHHFGL